MPQHTHHYRNKKKMLLKIQQGTTKDKNRNQCNFETYLLFFLFYTKFWASIHFTMFSGSMTYLKKSKPKNKRTQSLINRNFSSDRKKKETTTSRFANNIGQISTEYWTTEMKTTAKRPAQTNVCSLNSHTHTFTQSRWNSKKKNTYRAKTTQTPDRWHDVKHKQWE